MSQHDITCMCDNCIEQALQEDVGTQTLYEVEKNTVEKFGGVPCTCDSLTRHITVVLSGERSDVHYVFRSIVDQYAWNNFNACMF